MALEQFEESFPEAGVHEAVSDGVAAAGGVGQQLEVADGLEPEAVVHECWSEQCHLQTGNKQ